MTGLSIMVLAGLCFAIIFYGLLEKSRMIQYPFLAAGAVASQFVPQLIAASNSASALSQLGEFAMERVVVMTCLCLIGGVAGYYSSRRKPKAFNWEMNQKKILSGGLVLVGGGMLFGFLLSRLPEEQLKATQWSGLTVRYLFFASMGTYGFIFCFLHFLKTGNRMAFIGMLPVLMSLITVVIFHGRRTPAAILGLAVLSALWFCRRKLPPKWLMISGMLLFVLFVFSIGDYRKIQKSDDANKAEQIKNIRFTEKFKLSYLREERSIEIDNAMYIMEAVARTGSYDFGATLYNTFMVYVPRQLVGEDFKKALMARTAPEIAKEEFNYIMPIGSCTTGVADAFSAFSYFGCLIFFFQGWFMRRFWEGAMAGGYVYQMLYLAQAALQLGAFSGNIGNITAPWVHIAIFAGPVLLYAKTKKKVWDPKEAR